MFTIISLSSAVLLFSEKGEYFRWRRGFESTNQQDVIDVINEYLNVYGLNFSNVTNKFYFLPYGDREKFFVHEMIPENSTAIIIFLHGYLSHSGLFWDFYEKFLGLGYHIVAVDLPGHGLSDGVRTGIDDFGTYAKVVYNTYLNLSNSKLPVYFAGHSTGCSAILEFIHNYNIYPPKVVFVAPLVRIILWDLASFGYNLLGNNIRELPRLRRETSRNTSYLDFIFNKDPLKYEKVATSWFKAVYTWNQRITNYSKINHSTFLIVQGNEDEVVDWRYNIEFLRDKIMFSKIVLIDRGKHDLLAEADYIRNSIFMTIEKYLRQ